MYWAQCRPNIHLSSKLLLCDFYSRIICVASHQKHNQTHFHWQQPSQKLAAWKRNEARTTFHGEKQEGGRQAEWKKTKACHENLHISMGSTVSIVYCCIHKRAKLTYQLLLISKFWYNLTFECSASTLYVLQIQLCGCRNMNAAWREDNRSTRLCHQWAHKDLPSFQIS